MTTTGGKELPDALAQNMEPVEVLECFDLCSDQFRPCHLITVKVKVTKDSYFSIE